MKIGDAVARWDIEPGWLNSASYGVPPRAAFEALQQPLDEWRRGANGWDRWNPAVDLSRAAFARLVNAAAEDVAVGTAGAQVIAPVAASLPPGTRVLTPDIEHTSNLFPYLANGLDVRTAPADGLAEAIDADTDVVAFSLVQSATGQVADVEKVVAAARAHGALVVGDATQAAGWLPIDATLFDVLMVSAYKWLMCPRGTAFGYFSPEARDRFRPVAANWYAGEGDASYGPPLRLAGGARQFDIAVPWFSYVAAVHSLDLLNEIGVEQIREHDVRLANRFREGVGLEPGDSAIVTVTEPGTADRLEAAGLRFSVRGGGARLAFHLYNDEADVDAAVAALS